MTVAPFGSRSKPCRSPSGREHRYLLKHLLADGGCGEVWLARDRKLARDVVVKRIRAEWVGKTEIEEQFQLEALLTSRLEHPGVVPVHDLGRDGEGRLYYSMKYVQGRTFREEIEQLRIMPEGDAREEQRRRLYSAFVALANTIAFAHARGVIHLDLKPDNVVLGDFGETQVLDWGVASLRVGDEDSPRGKSASPTPAGKSASPTGAAQRRPQRIWGTLRYLAPERIQGESEVGPAADVYSLGAMLAEIVCADLRRRFPEANPLVPEETPEQLRRAARRFPGPLRSLCAKALANRPEDRFTAALDLAQEVERYLVGERVRCHPEGLCRRLARSCRRHPTLAVTICVGSLLLGSWAFERQLRRVRARELADRASQQAVSDWQAGRRLEALGRLRAATEQLESQVPGAEAWMGPLRRRRAALEAWLAFTACMDRARYYSALEGGQGEVERFGGRARSLASHPLPDEFNDDRTVADRRRLLGELSLIEGRFQAGGAGLDGPVGEEDRYLAARRLQLAGQHEAAAAAFQECLGDDPRDFWSMYFLAVCHEACGRDEAALACYTSAIALQPDSPQPFPLVNRGNLYRRLGRPQQAEADYHQAKSLGDDPTASHNLGLLYVDLGRLEEARQEFDRALALDAGWTPALWQRVRVLRALGQYRQAAADLERLRTLDPGAGALIGAEEALIRLQEGDLAGALACAQLAVRHDAGQPGDHASHAALGLVQVALGQHAAALAAFEAALARDPQNVGLRNNRAAVLMEMGRDDEAQKELDAVIDRQPSHASARFNRALIRARTGSFTGAAGDLAQVPPPSSDRERLEQIERCLQLASSIGSRAGQAQELTSSCLQRVHELLAERPPEFRAAARMHIEKDERLAAFLAGGRWPDPWAAGPEGTNRSTATDRGVHHE